MTTEGDYVTLTVEDYTELLKDQELLFALKAAGVDNWEGYEIALEEMERNNDD